MQNTAKLTAKAFLKDGCLEKKHVSMVSLGHGDMFTHVSVLGTKLNPPESSGLEPTKTPAMLDAWAVSKVKTVSATNSMRRDDVPTPKGSKQLIPPVPGAMPEELSPMSPAAN